MAKKLYSLTLNSDQIEALKRLCNEEVDATDSQEAYALMLLAESAKEIDVLPAPQLPVERRVTDVACPVCGAAAGEACGAPNGAPGAGASHTARIEAARAVRLICSNEIAWGEAAEAAGARRPMPPKPAPKVRLEFDDIAYRVSHGAAPRGRGSWAFALTRNPEPGSSAIWFAPGSLTYGQARKALHAAIAAGLWAEQPSICSGSTVRQYLADGGVLRVYAQP